MKSANTSLLYKSAVLATTESKEEWVRSLEVASISAGIILRARLIRKTYQPAFFHLGECATYQPAIDQSDWPSHSTIEVYGGGGGGGGVVLSNYL